MLLFRNKYLYGIYNEQNLEPLEYLDRKQLQLNIMRNIEQKILEDCSVEDCDSKGNLELKCWCENTPNWVKVQTFLNGNSKKAGSGSSTDQCIFLGVNPGGKSFYDMLQQSEPEN